MAEYKQITIFENTGTSSCNVKNLDGQFLGEIRRRKVGFYNQWVYCPVPTKKLGYLFLTNKQLKEISEQIIILRKQGRTI